MTVREDQAAVTAPEMEAVAGVRTRDDEHAALAVGASGDRIAMPCECEDGGCSAEADAAEGGDEEDEDAFH